MQQQPLEERLTSLEYSAERHQQTIARLDAILEGHDQLMERLVANQEFLQENLLSLQASQERMQASQDRVQASQDRMQETQDKMQDNHEAIVRLLEEVTRDAANTRRLWLRLAQRYGWMDDEQNGAQPETPT